MATTFLVDPVNALRTGFGYFGTITTDATTNGTSVDTQLTDGPVHGLFIIGNAGDAATVVQMKLQESVDGTNNWTDIPGAIKTLAASATANDNSTHWISGNYRTKRYVRPVIVTSGGGTPSVPAAAAVIGRLKISGTGTGFQA